MWQVVDEFNQTEYQGENLDMAEAIACIKTWVRLSVIAPKIDTELVCFSHLKIVNYLNLYIK